MNNKLQLDIITSIKFPLIVGVILIHSTLADIMFQGNLIEVDSYRIYNTISYLFSDLYGRLCVPLFFFISGFLFFYKVEEFSTSVYKDKLVKRVKTLLVPYILWHLITLSIYVVAEFVVPELFSGRNKLITDYSFIDFISCFWDMTLVDSSVNASPLPLYSPFWYLRDLIVVVLFTPFIYLFLKSRVRYVFLSLLIFLYVFDLWPNHISGFGLTAFCFFSLGSFFSINRINFTDFAQKILWLLLSFYIITLLAEILINEEQIIVYLSRINTLVGIGLIINLFAFLLSKGVIKPNKFISNSTFFLYAYHLIPLSLIKKVSFLLVPQITNTSLVFIYFICPMVVILFGLLLYYGLNKYIPKITGVLTGSR